MKNATWVRRLIRLRYVPPFDSYYRKFGNDLGTLKSGGNEYIAWRVVAAEFVTIDSGTGLVHQAPAFGEVDFDVLTHQRDRFKASEVKHGNGVAVCVTSLAIPKLICAVAPDGKFTDEGPRLLSRPLGQGLRQRHHPRSEKSRPALPPRRIPARISVLLAGRRRPAHPVSAAKLVHQNQRIQRPDARKQQPDQLAAGAHQGRPVRQLFGIERRLGLVPRTLLGHAAADLGVRKNRQHGGGGQLRRAAPKAGRPRDRSLGRCEKSQSATGRRSERSQTVHRRGHVPLAVRPNRADEARARSDRLLVRQRRDAICPMGIPGRGTRYGSIAIVLVPRPSILAPHARCHWLCQC